MNIKNFIGVDISKNTLDFAVISANEKTVVLEGKCENSIKELNVLKKQFRSHRVLFNKSTLVVCEHTGIYTMTLLRFLNKHKCPICVDSGARIKKSFGIQRGKSDKIDARRIAEYGFRNSDKLRIWTKPRDAVFRLRTLLTIRERYVKVRDALKTPLGELNNFYTSKELKNIRELGEPVASGVQQSLKNVELALSRLIRSDEKINRQVSLLTTIPGIGELIAAYFIVYTNEFSLFDSYKNLASYVGVAPFEHSSGTNVRGKTRVSHFANKKLKSLLHIAAIVTTRPNGHMKAQYDKKISEGKHPMSVLNIIRYKLVKRIMAVIKRGTPYVLKMKRKVVKRQSVLPN